jgi:hypothetical protein
VSVCGSDIEALIDVVIRCDVLIDRLLLGVVIIINILIRFHIHIHTHSFCILINILKRGKGETTLHGHIYSRLNLETVVSVSAFGEDSKQIKVVDRAACTE